MSDHGREVRIIPARAGFTLITALKQRISGDHPRSRGVYCADLLRICAEKGSSPLARGLHGVAIGDGSESRIIPARAGFTGARVDRLRCG